MGGRGLHGLYAIYRVIESSGGATMVKITAACFVDSGELLLCDNQQACSSKSLGTGKKGEELVDFSCCLRLREKFAPGSAIGILCKAGTETIAIAIKNFAAVTCGVPLTFGAWIC
eukprot:1158791-Pelagomonas_calceolata.AAC.1